MDSVHAAWPLNAATAANQARKRASTQSKASSSGGASSNASRSTLEHTVASASSKAKTVTRTLSTRKVASPKATSPNQVFNTTPNIDIFAKYAPPAQESTRHSLLPMPGFMSKAVEKRKEKERAKKREKLKGKIKFVGQVDPRSVTTRDDVERRMAYSRVFKDENKEKRGTFGGDWV